LTTELLAVERGYMSTGGRYSPPARAISHYGENAVAFRVVEIASVPISGHTTSAMLPLPGPARYASVQPGGRGRARVGAGRRSTRVTDPTDLRRDIVQPLWSCSSEAGRASAAVTARLEAQFVDRRATQFSQIARDTSARRCGLSVQLRTLS
jgi:hypothetical protein